MHPAKAEHAQVQRRRRCRLGRRKRPHPGEAGLGARRAQGAARGRKALVLAAFALLDAMAVPGIVIPSVGTVLGVEFARVRQQRPQRRALKQPPQHGSTGDVVECPNSINRKDCCPRTGLSCCAEEADDGLSPSRRAKAELEGQAGRTAARTSSGTCAGASSSAAL